jgi:hypothetical protein
LVNLKSWALTANMFDGDVGADPVPNLFADDPEGAAAAIQGEPAKAHFDIARLLNIVVVLGSRYNKCKR